VQDFNRMLEKKEKKNTEKEGEKILSEELVCQ
jgi:hypothetical protein